MSRPSNITLEQRCKRNRLYKIINGYTPGAELPATYLPQTIITRRHHSSRFILPAVVIYVYEVVRTVVCSNNK